MPKDSMSPKSSRPLPTRGGYPSGPKLISEFTPPPKRPGAGSKPKGAPQPKA
jgi:hypothetical protein